MKRNIIGIVLILSLFLLVGCDKEKKNEITRPHSEKEIQEIADRDNSITVTQENEEDKDVYTATINDIQGNNFKYYAFENKETATKFYNYHIDVYKSMKKDGDSEKNSDSIYELSTNDRYYYVRLDENSMVVADCDLDKKDSIIEMLKTINFY